MTNAAVERLRDLSQPADGMDRLMAADEIERLQQKIQDIRDDNETMRSVIVDGPGDGDAICWALKALDKYCIYNEATEAGREPAP